MSGNRQADEGEVVEESENMGVGEKMLSQYKRPASESNEEQNELAREQSDIGEDIAKSSRDGVVRRRGSSEKR